MPIELDLESEIEGWPGARNNWGEPTACVHGCWSRGAGLETGYVGLEPESEGGTLAPGCTGEGLSLGLWVQATRMVGGWGLE